MSHKKVVLVTGASSGLGKDFVKALLKEDFIVYAVARRLSQMDDLKELGAITLKMDITKKEDVIDVVKTVSDAHDGVDILINNAGFGLYGSVEDVSIEDARYQFEVNLFGLAHLTQLVLPYMRSKKSGKIINISSIVGKVYMPLGAWYTATKHALEGWSDCLRLDVKQFGIDVIIVEPGAINTEFSGVVMEPMLKCSKGGAYEKLAEARAKSTKLLFSKNKASTPSVITDLILKAIHDKKPKIRYVGGKYSTISLFLRKWFGDRIFDKFVLSQWR